MAGVIDALKMLGPLEVKRALTAALAEHGQQGDTAGFTLNISPTHSPDVTGQGTGMTSHPALHNGTIMC